jgi:hypothetical protein
MKMIISEFYSDRSRHSSDRFATVSHGSNNSYIVDMFEENLPIESRVIRGHNLGYAEDCAENWILGVIK